MLRLDSTLTAATLVAVAAAMLPTTLADTCDSLYQASFDCGTGFVSSGRASATCNDGNSACDASIAGANDHTICCMGEASAFNCSDTREGLPVQILGTEDPITGAKIHYDARTLDLVTGVYTDLFTVPVTRTTPSFTNMNACGINPIDFKLYCHVELFYQGVNANFLARVGDTQVHLVYRMADMDSREIFSGTVDVDGAYISFLKSPGRYFKVDATQNLPGFADPADCPFGSTLWITHAENDDLWHADIVSIAGGNFDGQGPARWLLGLTGTSQGNIGMLTKVSGSGVGTYIKLDLQFGPGQPVPNFSSNWGAAWNYDDNLVFAANDGSGVFIATIRLTSNTITMRLVSASETTRLNDGGNCGPPAEIPFATCQARLGPGTPATVQADCGAGWTVDTQSAKVCSFDAARGFGCHTGSDTHVDQALCCDRDCTGFCNGNGAGIADPFDIACTCTCDPGYAGGTCNQCAPAYVGIYPACVLSNAPSPAPTAAPTAAPDLTIDSVQVMEGFLATLTVTLSRPHDQSVTVDWATSDGASISTSAQAPVDYTAASGTVSIAAGATTATFQIATNTDAQYNELDELFSVTLTNANNANIAVPVGTVTIVNVPGVSVGDAIVPEGGLAAITVTLSRASSRSVTVNWATADVSAAQPADYTAATGTITFAPGQTVFAAYVQTTTDGIEEGDETFNVVLSSPNNVFITDGVGVVTIIDIPSVSVGDASVQEGQTAVVQITLSHVCSQSVTVSWADAPGSATVSGGDYDSATGTITFAPGDTVVTASFQTSFDRFVEGDEQFAVILSGATNAVISDGTGAITIIDVPAVSIGDDSVFEGGAAELTITLSGPSSQSTSVAWATVDGTAFAGLGGSGGASGLGDYVGTSGTVTFAPGQTSSTINIFTNGDGTDEGNENFSVVLSSPAGCTIDGGTGVVTILDVPTVSIRNVTYGGPGNPTTYPTGAVVTEGEVAVVQVCLSRASTKAESVSWSTADGTAQANADYVISNGVINWAPGVLCVSVSIPTIIDNEVEIPEHCLIVLSPPFVTSSEDAAIAVGTAVVVINEAPTVSIGRNPPSPPAPPSGGGGTGNPTTYPTGAVVTEGEVAVVPVCLSRVSDNTVTVAWSTAPGTAQSSTGDYVSSSGVITLAPGELCINVSIPTTIDAEIETPEYFTIVLSEPTNAAILVGTAVVVINEATPPTIIIGPPPSPPAPPTYPGPPAPPTYPGGQPPGPPGPPGVNPTPITVPEGEIVVVPVCLSDVSTSAVSVSWTTMPGTARAYAGSGYNAGGVDYVSGSGVLTWAPGQLCLNISIQTNVDDEDEGEEYFTIVLSEPQNAAIAVATARVVITEIEGYGRVTGGGAGNNGGNNPGSGEGGARYNGGGGVNGGDGYGGAMGMGSYTGGGKGNGGSESGSKGMGGNDNMGGSESGGKGNSGSESGGKGNGGSKGHGGSGEGGSKGGSDKGQGGKGGSKGTDSYGAMNSASAEAGGPSSGLTIAAYVFLVAGIGLVAVRQQRERAGYSLVPSDSPNANWYNRLSLSPKRPNERTPLNLIIDAQHPALV